MNDDTSFEDRLDAYFEGWQHGYTQAIDDIEALLTKGEVPC